MRRERLSAKDFVQIAVEATYYLAPRDPGLAEPDLVAAGATLGLGPGEIHDAIVESHSRSGGHLDRHRDLRYRLGDDCPYIQIWLSWEDNPRSVSTYEAIADEFLEHIRRHGKARRRIESRALAQAVHGAGHSLHQIEVELAMMELAHLLKREDEAIVLTDLGAASFSTDTRLPAPTVLQRPHFKAILDAVRPFVQARLHAQGAIAVPIRRRIFISHSSRNAPLAKNLVTFYKAALVVRADEEIFCSSLPGHELTAGDVEEAEILKLINEVAVVVGLLTREALTSPAVLMELGAAWALSKKFVPLLEDVEFQDIPAWVKRHAVKLSKSAEDINVFSRRLIAHTEEIAPRAGLEVRGRGEITAATMEFWKTFRAVA